MTVYNWESTICAPILNGIVTKPEMEFDGKNTFKKICLKKIDNVLTIEGKCIKSALWKWT